MKLEMPPMSHVSDGELRQNLSRYLDEAVENRGPVVVTRQGGKGNVVMMSEAEFSGWQETVHLLGSPRNTERRLRGLRQFVADQGHERESLPPRA